MSDLYAIHKGRGLYVVLIQVDAPEFERLADGYTKNGAPLVGIPFYFCEEMGVIPQADDNVGNRNL